MTYQESDPQTTSVASLRDLLRGLLTSAGALLEADELAELPGDSLAGALLSLAANHPEPQVARWLESEIRRFTDVEN